MPVPHATENQRSPGNGRDPALDGLRGLAILLVFLFHYGGGLHCTHTAGRVFGSLTQAGWVGVDLFFALSGYLITGLLWETLRQEHAFRNFFARRALRILPLYLGALAVAAVFALGSGAPASHLRPLLIYAGFLQNIPPLVAKALQYPPPLPLHHLWSLAVEEQFYLLWPFLLLAARSRERALHLCLWTFAVSAIFRAIFFAPAPLGNASAAAWSPFLLTRAGGLALGGALALGTSPAQSAFIRRWTLPGFSLAIAVFVATGLTTHTFLLRSWSSFAFALPAVQIGAVATIALVREPGKLRRCFDLAPLRLLGRISYGFYVLHILLEPLFDYLGRVIVHTSSGSAYQLARLLVAFPITAAAAWLSYTCFEQPFLRLKRFFPTHPGSPHPFA
ncbi:MAG: acyltransferase family protein [Janthinobacterium lividum]